MDSRFKKLFSNTLLIGLGSIGSRFIMFFLLPLYTNVLTVEQYGVTELVLIGTNILYPVVSLTIEDSVLRFGLDKKNVSGQVFKNAVLVMMCGTFVTLGLIPLIMKYNPVSEWATYLAIITILRMYRTVFSIYLKSVGNIKLFAIDSIIYALLLAIMNVLFLLVFKWGLGGFFLANVSATLLSTVFIVVSGGLINIIIKSTINHVLLKSMIIFSTPMIINALSWWLNSSSNRIILEYYLSAEAVGLYAVAAKMPILINSVTGIFNQSWMISSILEYDSTQEKSFYEKSFAGYNFLLVFISSVIILIIKPFMQFYVGPGFTESWRYVPYLLLGTIFLSYSGFFGAIYMAVRKNTLIMLTTMMGAVLNITLCIILIPRIGILGAALATMIAYISIGLYRMLNSRKYFTFNIDFKRTFASLFILIVQATFVSFDIYSIFISLVSIILILIINNQTAKRLIDIGLVAVKDYFAK